MLARTCSKRPTTDTVPTLTENARYRSDVSTEIEVGLPIRLLHDRVLVRLKGNEGERRSAAGILIPATASVGRRLSWATAVGVGPHVRSIVTGDRVLFDPDERSEVELQGRGYILLRGRGVEAAAAGLGEAEATA